MNEQNIDRLFKEKLAGHLQAPPAELANKLESKLDRQRRIAWYQFSRVAAALILIAASVYLFTNLSSLSEQPMGTEVAVTEKTLPKPIKAQEPQGNTFVVPPLMVNRIEPWLQPVNKQPTRPAKNASLVALNSSEVEKTAIETETVPVNQENETVAPARAKVTITYKKSIKNNEEGVPLLAQEKPIRKKSKKKKRFWRKTGVVDPSFTLAGLRTTKDQLLAINKKEKNKVSKPN